MKRDRILTAVMMVLCFVVALRYLAVVVVVRQGRQGIRGLCLSGRCELVSTGSSDRGIAVVGCNGEQ